MRCGESAFDCLIEHISRSLVNSRPGKRGTQSIRADCPACRRDCLTVTVGDVVRSVWTCHAGCDRADIRAAAVALGVSENCLPQVRPAKRPAPKRRTDAEIVRELRALLDEPLNGNAFRLRAAMLLLDVDAKRAADRLGIPERTRRRLLCP